jgi:hypothetical protein
MNSNEIRMYWVTDESTERFIKAGAHRHEWIYTWDRERMHNRIHCRYCGELSPFSVGGTDDPERLMNLAHSELPPGETFTGTTKDLRAGDYLMASVHGYSLVESVLSWSEQPSDSSTIRLINGFTESGYPYGRPIHRPNNSQGS